MSVLAWLVFLALLGFFFNDQLAQQFNPNRELDTRYSEQGVREVVLQRNRLGHYVTSGEINGEPVVFMLDTGATGVAIPAKIARRLGLRQGQAYRVETANGPSTAYATRLDSVSVGGIVRYDVEAGIAAGYQGDEILLGMSFLKHIDFSQRGDTLILRQAL